MNIFNIIYLIRHQSAQTGVFTFSNKSNKRINIDWYMYTRLLYMPISE